MRDVRPSPATTAPTESPATRRGGGRSWTARHWAPCAAAKARASADPVELPAGRYEVVLEPSAVMDVLQALAYAGCNGKAWNERRSFVRLGEDQLDAAITIVDDPLSAGYGYDRDGTPHQRLVLVDGGTSVAVTHDRRSAAEAGTESTGHANDAAFSFGPTASHLTLLPSGADAAAARSGTGGGRRRRAVRRRVGGRAGGRRGPGRAGLRPLVHPAARPPHPRPHRPHPQRHLAHRGRGARRTGPQLPLHPVVRPGADARQRQGRRADGHADPRRHLQATSPRWTCPALHLASWNFTGGASG